MKPSSYLPLLVYDSLFATGNLIDDNLAVKLNSLTVEKQIYGGYWKLDTQQNVTQSKGEEWLEYGLMRHIELYTPTAYKIWEGFVNSITFNVGGLSLTRGPVIGSVFNKIKVAYSTVDTSTTIPTMGIRDETAWANDTISQARYGILEQVVSVGGATPTSAVQLRTTALAERAEPATSESDNLSSSTIPSITITALGYMHFLNTYTLDLTTTGDQNVSDKLEAILGADPNSIFSTDYSSIETNAVQVGAYDRDLRIADGVVKAIVALGTATNTRTMFGFGNDRKAVYKSVPTSLKYQRRLAEARSRLESYTGGHFIEPFDAEVGEMVFYTDLLAGRPMVRTVAEQNNDPRYLRINHSTYTLPINLAIAGEDFSQLAQIMASFGLGGRSA